MVLTLKKINSAELRSVGLDERWLQNQIQDDTSLLGLGELEIVTREHRQPVGGRIDFLMRNDETYYEVEIMLGTLDESHIIRTIEYWDVERQRRPDYDHRAVIVAEQITSRFFNVTRLLNRSVPMIAVQLNAFKLNEAEIVLCPVTVLNIRETQDDVDVDPVERVDRPYWERKASPNFLAVIDAITAGFREQNLDPRVTYNRHHVALGTSGYNFCWFHPRARLGDCHIECRLTNETRDDAIVALQNGGVNSSPVKTEFLGFIVTPATLTAHQNAIMDVLKRAEDISKR